MLLGYETLKKISYNCLEIEQINDKFILKRFTDKQVENYKNNNVAYAEKSLCTSAICFDFYTDSQYIKFKYDINARGMRDWLGFDFYLNDIFTDSIIQKSIKNIDTGVVCFKANTDKTQNRFTIYFPYTAGISVYDVEIENNAVITPVPARKKLLILGDSITQGYDAAKVSMTYTVQLSRFLNMELLNQGIGGYYFNKKSLDENINYKPDLIIVSYGSNDWNFYKKDKFEHAVDGYFKKLTKIFPLIPIIDILPIWRKDINSESKFSFSELHEIIAEACGNYPQVHVCNGLSLVPNMEEFYADGVHPNDEGMLIYTLNLVKYIRDIFSDCDY